MTEKNGFYSTQKCHYLVCTRTFCNLWCRINVTILWTSGSLRISHDHFYSYKFCFISFHLSYVSARVINAVGIVCGAGSMERSGVRPSARLCVCLSRRSDVGSCCRSSAAAGAAYGPLIDSCRHPSCGCGQRYVESRGTRLTRNLLHIECRTTSHLFKPQTTGYLPLC